jgi:hypothetical protein
MVAWKTPIFPCIEVLKWLIDHTNKHKFLINDENGGCVGVFLPIEVHKYYKIRDPEEQLNTDFVVKFYDPLGYMNMVDEVLVPRIKLSLIPIEYVG